MTSGPDPSLAYFAARDALGSTAPLAFEQEFPLLGIPLRVRSNARKAIELASASFSVWDGLDGSRVDRDVSVEMRVIVHDSPDAAGAAAQPDWPFVYRRHGPVLVAASGATLLTIDLAHRLYVAFVPPAALERSEWYAWHVNGMARFAASALDRHPFHAATWLVGGTAVIVTGPAGGGKSTLAYAALRQSFPLLSEEATHVSLAHGLRFWGHAEHIALGADAISFFPELAACPARLLPSGKVKRAYVVAGRQPLPPLTHDGPAILCLLTDGRTGPPSVEPLSASERDEWLSSDPEGGFDQFPDDHERLVRAFANTPAFLLSVGADPSAAVAALARLAGGHAI